MNVPPPRSAAGKPGKVVRRFKKAGAATASNLDQDVSLPTEPNIPPENLQDYNWMIYGTKNIGKTCVAALFPDVQAHFLGEPGRRDVATPIIPKRGEAPLTWARFQQYVTLLREQPKPGRIILDTVDTLGQLCERHHAALAKVPTLMAMTDNGRAWRGMLDDWHNTLNSLLWGDWRVTILSHVRVRDRVTRNLPRDKVKEAKAQGIVVPETQPSCSGWVYEWTKVVASIVGCFVYRGRDRVLYIRGHEVLYASPGGGGVGEAHFLDQKTKEPYDAIYMGTSPTEAWDNLQEAWDNKHPGLFCGEEITYQQ